MKILYFDTETTWFSPPAIVQLWFINEFTGSEGGWYKEKWNYLFNPQISINPRAAEVHWLTDSMVKNEPLFHTKLKEFVKITKEVDYICWHNVQFDFKALFFEVDRIKWDEENQKKIDSWKKEIQWKSICTMQTSIDLCKIPWRFWKKYKWPKLSELHIHLFWEDFEWAHDAMANIVATRRCFLKMKEMWLFPEIK